MPQRIRGSSRRVRIVTAVVAVGLCGLLTACEPRAPMPVPTHSPSATAIPMGDGALTIGTLFPTTGGSAHFARSQSAGVELAVREINEAGGVNGEPVVVFHRDSGGASTTKAEESFDDLVAKGVDVVIGPSSSEIAERLLPAAISAGVAMISPSAASLTPATLDHAGLLFHMTASDAFERKALATMIGKRRVAVVHYSDNPGRELRNQLATELESVGGELVVGQGFSERTTDAEKVISVIAAATPDVVVFTSPPSAQQQNAAILLALSKANLAGSALWLTSRSLADYSTVLPAGTLTGVRGILEGAIPDAGFQKRLKSADPFITSSRYAAEAYDATILAALAVTVTGNDSGVAVSRTLRDVSAGGVTCMSYGECLDVVTSRTDIDYDGVSGPLGFDADGNLSAAMYGIFGYGTSNRFTRTGTVVAE